MPSEPATTPQNDPGKPQGYQPSTGRKLFMLVLCIVGLIVVWTYYYFTVHQPPANRPPTTSVSARP
jgi:hypothetical protein